jgi:hypothetical protein
MNPFFVTDFSISDSLKTVRKSVLIYETIIPDLGADKDFFSFYSALSDCISNSPFISTPLFNVI